MYQLTLLDLATGRRHVTTEAHSEDAVCWLDRTIRAVMADRPPGEPASFELTWWDLDAGAGRG